MPLIFIANNDDTFFELSSLVTHMLIVIVSLLHAARTVKTVLIMQEKAASLALS